MLVRSLHIYWTSLTLLHIYWILRCHSTYIGPILEVNEAIAHVLHPYDITAYILNTYWTRQSPTSSLLHPDKVILGEAHIILYRCNQLDVGRGQVQ